MLWQGFTNGKTYASDVLIGCDGGASKVRACVFGDEVVNYTGQQVAFRALLPMSNVPRTKSKPMSAAINRAVSAMSACRHVGFTPDPDV